MSAAAPEFSRLVSLARLGSEPFHQEIAADESERAALAARFGLLSLDRLSAVVELVRERGGMILLTAAFVADFVQECVVTLEPLPGSLAAEFALRYGPPEAEPVSDSDDEPTFEPLLGDTIDIGEAVAQEFSLSLAPFPRSPDVIIEKAPPEGEAADDGPFAALARLPRREPE